MVKKESMIDLPSHRLAQENIIDRIQFICCALGRTGGPAKAGCRPDPALWAIGPWRPEAEGRRPLEAPEGVDRKDGRPDPERSRGGGKRPDSFYYFSNFPLDKIKHRIKLRNQRNNNIADILPQTPVLEVFQVQLDFLGPQDRVVVAVRVLA